MVEILLICVGKNKEKFYRDAVSEYIKRLSSFCRINIMELQEAKLSAEPTDKDIEKALSKEAEEIIKILKKEQYVISLCIEGKHFSSAAFADSIQHVFLSGKSKIVFIIGGSYGLSQSIKERSDLKMSLSELTFPHHLARVVLVEQIYRAFTITEGIKYHK